jgi:hypothetical protein
LVIFFAVQGIFGFPIKNLIRNEFIDDTKVVIKNHKINLCVVKSSSDHEPTKYRTFLIIKEKY